MPSQPVPTEPALLFITVIAIIELFTLLVAAILFGLAPPWVSRPPEQSTSAAPSLRASAQLEPLLGPSR